MPSKWINVLITSYARIITTYLNMLVLFLVVPVLLLLLRLDKLSLVLYKLAVSVLSIIQLSLLVVLCMSVNDYSGRFFFISFLYIIIPISIISAIISNLANISPIMILFVY